MELVVDKEYMLFRDNKYIGNGIYKDTREMGRCFIGLNNTVFMNIDYYTEIGKSYIKDFLEEFKYLKNRYSIDVKLLGDCGYCGIRFENKITKQKIDIENDDDILNLDDILINSEIIKLRT